MKPNGNGGVVHFIEEESGKSTDAEFINQIQQGYHNNCGNSRGRGNNRGQSRGRGNRGHFSRGYYTKRVTTVATVRQAKKNLPKQLLTQKSSVCSAKSSAITKMTAENASRLANLVKQHQEKNTFPKARCTQLMKKKWMPIKASPENTKVLSVKTE